MVGNLTHIMNILLAFCVAYIAKNCPAFGEKVTDALWVFSLMILTMAIAGMVVSAGEYYGLWG